MVTLHCLIKEARILCKGKKEVNTKERVQSSEELKQE